MIIKGRSRKDGGQLARYVLSENEQQKAFILDYRGTAVDDLKTMFRSWEAEAYAVTKGQKPLYHVQIRLAPGEILEKSQWFKTLEELEKSLKLTTHPRAVVAHNLNGEAHLHVVYSRLDSERGILLNMGNDRKAHHAIERKLEKEFGLRQLESSPRRDRNGNEKTRSIEHRMAKEAGTTRNVLCNLIKAAWDSSKTGREFQVLLECFDITMTYGDRRDFNIWHKGKRYNPVRLLEEVRVREFRAKMQIDPPLIGERGKASGDGPTLRKAKNLTHEQIVPQLNQIQQELPAENKNDASVKPTFGNAIPRQAENLPHDEAAKQIIPELAVPRPTWRRMRVPRQPRPRLRPKIFYDDPGI